MASATTLTLKNASAVNVSYYPIRINTGELALYVDRTQSVLAGQSKASLSFREDATTRKIGGKITYPVLAADGSLNYSELGTFNMVIPLKATLADRQELRCRLAALIADAIVTAAVDNGETPW